MTDEPRQSTAMNLLKDAGLCYTVNGDAVVPDQLPWPIGFRLSGEIVWTPMPEERGLALTYPCNDYEYLFAGKPDDGGRESD